MDWRLIKDVVVRALYEDSTWGDITSEALIDPKNKSEMVFVLKEDGVLAGMKVAEMVFKEVDPEIEWQPLHFDGERIKGMTSIINVRGNSLSILRAERIALNFLQRLCGIATNTRKFVDEVEKVSKNVRIVDTRKTTPGLRYLERYAVRVGGGFNHRNNLSDSVLIKDNHLSIIKEEGKSIIDAIKFAKSKLSHTVKIEVEVDSLDQLKEVIKTDVDSILLDNMSCDKLKQAVSIINGKALAEASGGVSLKTVAEIAATGVDIISVGELTYASKSLDISLDYKTKS